MPTQWNEIRPPDRAWRPKAGLSRAARAAEQDKAAGGRDQRKIVLPTGGYAIASVYLRLPAKSRRIYAYIRWSDSGKTIECYVCQVDDTSRARNLAAAWRAVAESDIAKAGGTDKADSTAQASRTTSDAVRAVMRANKGRDMRPELALRSAVHVRGLRYRVNARPLPSVRRTGDIVFPGQRIAVLLDGVSGTAAPNIIAPRPRTASSGRPRSRAPK